MNRNTKSSFATGLISGEPSLNDTEKLMLYGQFVGDWVANATEFYDDGSIKQSKWDIRFEWVLEGRAIQDLWISPIRESNESETKSGANRYGTTLRIYDPNIDGWHIVWANPPSGTVVHQIGRLVGNEIIQVGNLDNFGNQSRWVYKEITQNSFRWCNEKTFDNGKTWKLVQDMYAVRR